MATRRLYRLHNLPLSILYLSRNIVKSYAASINDESSSKPMMIANSPFVVSTVIYMPHLTMSFMYVCNRAIVAIFYFHHERISRQTKIKVSSIAISTRRPCTGSTCSKPSKTRLTATSFVAWRFWASSCVSNGCDHHSVSVICSGLR